MAQKAPLYVEIVLIGNVAVGKTSIVKSFIGDDKRCIRTKFSYGMMHSCENIKIDGIPVNITIWDTDGLEHIGSVPPGYFRYADGAMLVYDVTYRKSFVDLEEWLKQLHNHCTRMDPVIIIVGNQIDFSYRDVSTEEGLEFAKKHRALFTQCSAETSEGIKGCFEMLVRKILQESGEWKAKYSKRNSGSADQTVVDDQPQKDPSSCCIS